MSGRGGGILDNWSVGISCPTPLRRTASGNPCWTDGGGGGGRVRGARSSDGGDRGGSDASRRNSAIYGRACERVCVDDGGAVYAARDTLRFGPAGAHPAVRGVSGRGVHAAYGQ